MFFFLLDKCVYAGKSYFQSQTWQVGCEYECICDDAGAGLWSCQSRYFVSTESE